MTAIKTKQLGSTLSVADVSANQALPLTLTNVGTIAFHQTTAGISVTLPAPTEDMLLCLVNKGSQSITVGTTIVTANGVFWALYSEGSWSY